jgi:hypothetical protein
MIPCLCCNGLSSKLGQSNLVGCLLLAFDVGCHVSTLDPCQTWRGLISMSAKAGGSLSVSAGEGWVNLRRSESTLIICKSRTGRRHAKVQS